MSWLVASAAMWMRRQIGRIGFQHPSIGPQPGHQLVQPASILKRDWAAQSQDQAQVIRLFCLRQIARKRMPNADDSTFTEPLPYRRPHLLRFPQEIGDTGTILSRAVPAVQDHWQLQIGGKLQLGSATRASVGRAALCPNSSPARSRRPQPPWDGWPARAARPGQRHRRQRSRWDALRWRQRCLRGARPTPETRRHEAKSMAGLTIVLTPAAAARSITASRSTSNWCRSRWQWVSTHASAKPPAGGTPVIQPPIRQVAARRARWPAPGLGALSHSRHGSAAQCRRNGRAASRRPPGQTCSRRA